jgi:hypothetical protein
MNQIKSVALSTIIVAIVFGFSAFSAQPTIASGLYHFFLVLPGLFIIKLVSDFEGYKKARDELAPGKPLGHSVYRVIEWMETPHLGLLGVWYVVILAALLMIYKLFH